jgi:chemotaxis response regulator CheB
MQTDLRRPDALARAGGPGPYRLVVIAAPAGGVRALARILRRLPPDFGAPVALVQYRPPTVPDLLGTVLSRIVALPVRTVGPTGQPLEPGHLYIAPADHHLFIDGAGQLAARRGARYGHEGSSGKAIFESAARAFPGNVIAVVLSAHEPETVSSVKAVADSGGVILWQSSTFGPEGIADALLELAGGDGRHFTLPASR